MASLQKVRVSELAVSECRAIVSHRSMTRFAAALSSADSIAKGVDGFMELA